MGSLTDLYLPPANPPTLILSHPTPSERRKIWAQSHPKWGAALYLDEYLHREEYLMTVPLAKGGGIAHWILTIDGVAPDDRPILSSCETLRKRAFIATKEDENGMGVKQRMDWSLSNGNHYKEGGKKEGSGVKEAVAHGIGSVFTDPQFRGNGYASRMMELVGEHLKNRQGNMMNFNGNWGQKPSSPPATFSVLFSDIGKKFYAARGWAPFPSTHLSFPPQETMGGTPPNARPISYHDLPELCALDEKWLLKRMANERNSSNGTCVALAPDLDAMLWHLMREDFVTKRIFGWTPRVRGAAFGKVGKRIWAIWSRSYLSKPPKAEGNTLYILRVVIEDESADPVYLSEGLRVIIEFARNEAFEWQTRHVELWNPSRQLRDLIRGSGLEYEAVEREIESIPSLRWYGECPSEEIEWMANEKYAWY
jgi:GNAT superfamily N-acetyltransferase